jgi:hypothetical protein
MTTMSASTRQGALPFFVGLFVASSVWLALFVNHRIRQDEELSRARMRIEALELQTEQLNQRIRWQQRTQPGVPRVPLSAPMPRPPGAMRADRDSTARNLKAITEALAAYADANREYPFADPLQGISEPFARPPSSQATTGGAALEHNSTGERP